MFGKRIDLFKLFGFTVRIDLSWVVIAALITWSLAAGFFPLHYQHLSALTYWLMGVIGAVGFFLSIVAHELFHSLVARKFEIPMKGITLFIFGGVSEMDAEPTSAKAEFWMAIVGPLSSIGMGLLFYGLHLLFVQREWPDGARGIVQYLAYINLLLAGFNLIPAFPLDGGRILRAVLWGLKKNLRWATRVSSWIGYGFGILLVLNGVFQFFSGNLLGGVWSFLIGMFLQNAARMSYQQLLLRKALEGERVRRFMKTDPVTVTSSTSVQELVEDYIYKYHFKMFPVVEDSHRLVGCVTTKQVQAVPREQWDMKRVGEIGGVCLPENMIGPEEDAMKALSMMARTGLSRLMVIEEDRIIGILALKDLLKFFKEKLELEQ